MNFEKLREMESFTQDMFNRILAFQDKEHAAWDESLDFSQRINNLPLHYMVFSNGDRNPDTHGPTVNHFYPLRNEMQTLANYINQLGAGVQVTDVEARNGFVGSLLAREGISVTGLRSNDEKPGQIENFYDASCYKITPGDISTLDKTDVVFSSWLSADKDLSQDILRLNPSMVIYIYSETKDPETHKMLTGTENSFGEGLGDAYRILDEWQIERPEDLFHAIWPDLTPSPTETRHTRVLVRADIDISQQRIDAGIQHGYDWEKELDMALTAHIAKAEVEKRGFPTGNAL